MDDEGSKINSETLCSLTVLIMLRHNSFLLAFELENGVVINGHIRAGGFLLFLGVFFQWLL